CGWPRICRRVRPLGAALECALDRAAKFRVHCLKLMLRPTTDPRVGFLWLLVFEPGMQSCGPAAARHRCSPTWTEREAYIGPRQFPSPPLPGSLFAPSRRSQSRDLAPAPI